MPLLTINMISQVNFKIDKVFRYAQKSFQNFSNFLLLKCLVKIVKSKKYKHIFSLGKLVQGASDFFNPSPPEAQTEGTIAPQSKTTTTEHSSQSHEQKVENNSGPFDAVVVDAIDLPPVRSNIDPNQPLR